MLTKLVLRNFKRFGSVEIDLGNPVVFIGPNNSGKTSALQALALWDLGLRKWREKRKEGKVPAKRPGVTINRKDFVSAQVPNAKLLWKDGSVQIAQREASRSMSKPVYIEVLVAGITDDVEWECGFEYHYANEEGFYCKPLKTSDDNNAPRMPIPPGAISSRVAFLPPMSGLAAQEFIKSPGEISYLIGQGRTAEVLRNLCYQLFQSNGAVGPAGWVNLRNKMEELFLITLTDPELIGEHAEISLSYRDNYTGCELDISSSGRGVQQILLLLAYMTVNPGAIILLDEPDAHLEILRQREVYKILADVAERQGNQLILASHSEVILNEASNKDVVVAFVGKPHRVNDRGKQAVKALTEIGFDQYYQAEQTGFVLYFEGSTDLSILQSFAQSLDHPAKESLRRPFVRYIGNQPTKGRSHFRGLREAKTDLLGYMVCDRGDSEMHQGEDLKEFMWSRREIENYLCQPSTLLRFAEHLAMSEALGPLFESSEAARLRDAMEEAIRLQVPPIALQDLQNAWWINTKVSENFLEPVFENFFKATKHENLIRKTNFHRLAPFVAREEISEEVVLVLDQIGKQAALAKPTE